MDLHISKPEENNSHIIKLNANMTTLIISGCVILFFIFIGINTLYQGVKEILAPKATYLVYHCKKGKKIERVPEVVDGVIKTENDIWNLTANIEARENCKVIIEPSWHIIRAERFVSIKDKK